MKHLLTLLLMTIGLTSYAQKFQSDKFSLPSGKELSITFIKHGTLMLSYDGHTIHIDPVGMYADYSKLPKADLILITHQHGDHLDKEAIATLSTPDTRLIVTSTVNQQLNKGEIYENGQVKRPFPWLMIETVPAYNTTPDRQKFLPKGRDNAYVLNIEDQRIYIAGDTEDIPTLSTPDTHLIVTSTVNQQLNKGEIYENGQVKRPFPWLMIETVPAYNTTPDRQKFHPKGRDNAYVLNIEDQRIYIAGDTEDIPEMKHLKDIDNAILPVNQPYTMTLEQALNAARMVKPTILYPYHYNDTKVEELVAPLKEEGIEVRIRDLQ